MSFIDCEHLPVDAIYASYSFLFVSAAIAPCMLELDEVGGSYVVQLRVDDD